VRETGDGIAGHRRRRQPTRWRCARACALRPEVVGMPDGLRDAF